MTLPAPLDRRTTSATTECTAREHAMQEVNAAEAVDDDAEGEAQPTCADEDELGDVCVCCAGGVACHVV